MRQYFQTHAVPAALFYGTLAVWLAIEVRQRFNRRADAAESDRGSFFVVGFSWVAAIGLSQLLRSAEPGAAFPNSPVTAAIGLAILITGVALRWWCFRTLGRYFTVRVMTSPDQRVIDSGPYRVLRHPSYTALLLCFAGIGIVFANWAGLLAMTALPFLGLLNRIRVEEAALAATIGDSYRSYAAGRKRLIPFVW